MPTPHSARADTQSGDQGLRSKRGRTNWRGYLPAIITPFNEALELDLAMLGVHLEWLEAEGMHGLVAAGTTGEWTSLSPQERKQLFQAMGAQMKGKLPLLAGCTAFTPGEVLDFAASAHASGFDGILLTPPPYIRPNENEIFAFYQTVSNGSALPICVYNWPPGTGIDMSLELLQRLAELEQIVAIKQSTGRLDRFVATFLALGDHVRIFGFSMDEHGLALLSSRGGDGTIGAGGPLGRDHPDFFNHIWAGDLDAARVCGARDRRVLEDWYTPDLVGRFGSGPAILKAAFNIRGVPAGRVRPPLLDVCEDDRKRIAMTLQALDKI
jgi:4-hydroxy-tetrahydrodipicolinate synthase